MKGFTLVELLITVSIISILSAIALPNFLAAQTRAKVSRATSDLRILKQASEQFHIDNQNYPFFHYEYGGTHAGGAIYAYGEADPLWNGANPITTPVAYLSSFPLDPFQLTDSDIPSEAREYQYIHYPYALKKLEEDAIPAHYQNSMAIFGDYKWFSIGPLWDGFEPDFQYDPTNGTVSGGDIILGQRSQ